MKIYAIDLHSNEVELIGIKRNIFVTFEKNMYVKMHCPSLIPADGSTKVRVV